MDRLLQVVLLIVAIAASSYSYNLQRHEPQMPEIPEEHNLDDDFPTEYIEKLVDALSPEELQRLRNIIDLQHRDSTPSSSKCASYSHNSNKSRGKDATGTEYFIVNTALLPSIPTQECNYTMKYHCTDDYNYRATRANCCVAVKEMRTLLVLSTPVGENPQNATIIPRDLYINTRCECKNDKPLDANDLKYSEDKICQLRAQQ